MTRRRKRRPRERGKKPSGRPRSEGRRNTAKWRRNGRRCDRKSGTRWEINSFFFHFLPVSSLFDQGERVEARKSNSRIMRGSKSAVLISFTNSKKGASFFLSHRVPTTFENSSLVSSFRFTSIVDYTRIVCPGIIKSIYLVNLWLMLLDNSSDNVLLISSKLIPEREES